MALYEERLATDLAKIRDKVAEVGSQVDEALEKAVKAVLAGDHDLANEVILGDHAVNRGFAEIDQMCHTFLALHLPSAGHLRFVSSILRLNAELERIGDHAATIAREALQLSRPPGQSFRGTVVAMAGDSQEMLRRAVKAFNGNDADLARETMGIPARVLKEFDKVFHDLAVEGAEQPASVRDLLVLSVIFSKLERVSARAENICEETLFAVTGETPARKRFNVLFLDEANSGQSRLAEAVGRKTASQTCDFSSMGRAAAPELHPGLKEFMASHGLSPGEAPPRALPAQANGIADYDVVVSLQGPVKSYLPEQPFHTVFLNWDVGDLPGGAEHTERVDRYYDMYRELTVRIRDLAERLRGEKGA